MSRSRQRVSDQEQKLEQAYWEFIELRKRVTSERDAFKYAVRGQFTQWFRPLSVATESEEA